MIIKMNCKRNESTDAMNARHELVTAEKTLACYLTKLWKGC